jgi:hypothetical protein
MKGQRISYSAAEMAWLEANRSMIISDYHRAFVAAFPRDDVTAGHLHSLRKRMGWKVGRAPGRTAGRHWRYSAAEIDWLRANCTLPIEQYHAAFTATFDRHDVSAGALNGVRKKHGWKTGRTGQFAAGQTPPNKGKPCPPGVGGRHPNAQRTQFRKGQLPLNTKFAGHERINVDGYVEISVEEENPYTGFERRYVHKHVWLWTKANGPVPHGCVLKCLDCDKTNTDPANWAPIPRSVMSTLNGGRHKKLPGYNEVAPELRPTILALAQIKVRASKLCRGETP